AHTPRARDATCVVAGAVTDGLARGATRPQSIRIAPKRSRSVGGFDRTHQDDVTRGILVHRAFRAAGMTIIGGERKAGTCAGGEANGFADPILPSSPRSPAGSDDAAHD